MVVEQDAMVGVLILTHGGVAPELLASAKVIAGELENFHALALPWTDRTEEAGRKVKELLPIIDQGKGVLILTDIFGGTPSNVAMALRQPHRIEVISGVNLPMVVRLGCLRRRSEMDVSQLATFIRDKTKKSICCSSGLPGPDGTAREARETMDPLSECAEGISPPDVPSPSTPSEKA